ncbi:DUF1707 SHOCT-like domain-containing protein [Tenggerimyces flavus]|uniref:DUF1707 domain-containing protein n=1 Tax=Tenggerimyces flavus TaxID=1708749 RepID=A0ABV7YDJ8_9ACTN|nr:DUF1707 domain-containing protein [Tenggerimyces flavus]MBM7787206.1 hypothetical protein [Tenggerimyces flavus]
MTSDWASRPRIRARDVDREYAMGLLRHASADGKLSYEEFEQRLAIAMRARTLGELASLVDDLEDPPPVPVVPVAPYPYVYAPARADRTRSRRRGIAALVAGAMALVVVGSLATAYSSMTAPTAAPVPEAAAVAPLDPCFGVPAAEVDLARCVAAGNPLINEGLSARAAERQKDLDLPGNLPVPARATFVQPGWVSATYNEDGRQQLTRRWHLEYLLASKPGEPVIAEHLAEVYRSTVAPVTYGTLSQKTPNELHWTGGPYPLTVSITPDGERWRVRLDVSVDTSTSIMRPDVSGEFRQQLKVLRTATVPGMMYESSKVTWTGATSCRLEQVWSATPDQFDQIAKQAKDLDATIEAKPEGGTRLVFQAVLRDCTTFQL